MKIVDNPIIKIFILFISIAASCDPETREEAINEDTIEVEARSVDVPRFNADSAYMFVSTQVAFGPRVPNTEAHRKTGEYLAKKLESYGAKVVLQEFQETTFDNENLALKNIIASFYPEKKRRILLAAHWDTRPYADKDPDNKYKPIDGANDGASGVGVLLEIARALGASKAPEVGIDIILFDGEDWGEWLNERPTVREGLDSWWCLGSQYWAKNKHEKGYSAYYGILLDMVGAKDSKFYKEGLSVDSAPSVVNKVWNRAAQEGYSSFFIDTKKTAITDDHKYMNQAGIPSIDIVHHDPKLGYFGDYHHTHKDNMDLISKETLKAVGQTVLSVLYYEEAESIM